MLPEILPLTDFRFPLAKQCTVSTRGALIPCPTSSSSRPAPNVYPMGKNLKVVGYWSKSQICSSSQPLSISQPLSLSERSCSNQKRAFWPLFGISSFSLRERQGLRNSGLNIVSTGLSTQIDLGGRPLEHSSTSDAPIRRKSQHTKSTGVPFLGSEFASFSGNLLACVYSRVRVVHRKLTIHVARHSGKSELTFDAT